MRAFSDGACAVRRPGRMRPGPDRCMHLSELRPNQPRHKRSLEPRRGRIDRATQLRADDECSDRAGAGSGRAAHVRWHRPRRGKHCGLVPRRKNRSRVTECMGEPCRGLVRVLLDQRSMGAASSPIRVRSWRRRARCDGSSFGGVGRFGVVPCCKCLDQALPASQQPQDRGTVELADRELPVADDRDHHVVDQPDWVS
jgi:hypothetical protein